MVSVIVFRSLLDSLCPKALTFVLPESGGRKGDSFFLLLFTPEVCVEFLLSFAFVFTELLFAAVSFPFTLFVTGEAWCVEAGLCSLPALVELKLALDFDPSVSDLAFACCLKGESMGLSSAAVVLLSSGSFVVMYCFKEFATEVRFSTACDLFLVLSRRLPLWSFGASFWVPAEVLTSLSLSVLCFDNVLSAFCE